MPKTYVHKATEIEAIQLTPENFDECVAFIGEDNAGDGTSKDECHITLKVGDDERSIHESDWIVKGVLDVFYPVTNAVFEQSYDEKAAQ
jgi:hypothetical protein